MLWLSFRAIGPEIPALFVGREEKKGLERKVPLDRVVEKPFWKLGPARLIMKRQRKRRNLKASGGVTTYYSVGTLTEENGPTNTSFFKSCRASFFVGDRRCGPSRFKELIGCALGELVP